ncbi:DegQ family serine endoprotease [bacterium]|nr:MAG: DegQ family serine endoprotease [bacterium]
MKKTGFGIKTLIVVAALSVVIGVLITARFDITPQTVAQNFWKDGSGNGIGMPVIKTDNFVELAKKLSPAVVNISTSQIIKERPIFPFPFPEFKGPSGDDQFGDEFDKFFGNNRENEQPQRKFKRQSLGSGFIINKDGYILTNQHVIDNASEIIVTLSDQHKKDYKAKVVGQDQKLDIALIKINAETDLPVAALGNSDELQIGEWVIAIGNPFGLGGTVTAGIISQKGRFIGAGPYDNFIQTDASINPGNSGGPLFNMKGEVIALNTAIIAGGQGIGFAIPVNMVKDVLIQLKERGKVTRGWIGVSIQDLTPELAKSFDIKESNGALVSSVTSGDPADLAGIKTGDIIISFDDKLITEMNDLPRIVASTVPGRSVEVKILRDGKEKTLSLRVGTKADDEAGSAEPRDEKVQKPDKKIGISVAPLTPEIAGRLGVADTEGVYISAVAQESPAWTADIRRGDIIKEINRTPIKNMKDYNKAILLLDKSETARFLIKRGGGVFYRVVKLKEK